MPTFLEHCKAFADRRGRFVDMHEDDNSSSSLHTSVASRIPSFDTLDVSDDDEDGDVGAAGMGDLCVPSTAASVASSSTNPTAAILPQARGVPSTVVGAASLSANPTEAVAPQARDVPSTSTAAGAASLSTNPTAAVPPQARGMPSTVLGAASLSANPAHPLPQKAKALPGLKTYMNDAHISLRLSIAEQLCRSGVHLITNAPLRKQGKVNMYQNNVLSPMVACMA
jgi:hypothetical protein